jgi:hypothetical protein
MYYHRAASVWSHHQEIQTENFSFLPLQRRSTIFSPAELFPEFFRFHAAPITKINSIRKRKFHLHSSNDYLLIPCLQSKKCYSPFLPSPRVKISPSPAPTERLPVIFSFAILSSFSSFARNPANPALPVNPECDELDRLILLTL